MEGVQGLGGGSCKGGDGDSAQGEQQLGAKPCPGCGPALGRDGGPRGGIRLASRGSASYLGHHARWERAPRPSAAVPGSSRQKGSDFSFQIQFLSNTSRFFSPSFNSVTQADSYTVYRSPATGLPCHISPVNLPVCQLSLSLSSRPDKYSFYWGIFHFSLFLSPCSSFPSLASSASAWAVLSCTC